MRLAVQRCEIRKLCVRIALGGAAGLLLFSHSTGHNPIPMRAALNCVGVYWVAPGRVDIMLYSNRSIFFCVDTGRVDTSEYAHVVAEGRHNY